MSQRFLIRSKSNHKQFWNGDTGFEDLTKVAPWSYPEADNSLPEDGEWVGLDTLCEAPEEIARLKAEKAELVTALKAVKEKSKGSAWSCNQEMRDRWTEAIEIVEAILKSQRGEK